MQSKSEGMEGRERGRGMMVERGCCPVISLYAQSLLHIVACEVEAETLNWAGALHGT